MPVERRDEEEQVARRSTGTRPANELVLPPPSRLRNELTPLLRSFELASQLQQEEEDALAHERRQEYRRREAAERAPAVLAPGALSVGPEAVAGNRVEFERRTRKEKKKKDCVIM